MGVYAAMSVAGGAISLIAGDLLTMYISWRWVSFVDVPIGLAAALAAPRVLAESRRQRGRFDLPGAVTGTGVSHGGDAKVVAALAASAVLLAASAVIEARSKHPVLPRRLLADRDRTGASLIMLWVGTAPVWHAPFPAPVRAGRLGNLRAQGRPCLLAAKCNDHDVLRRRRPARLADRRAPAAARRCHGRRWRPVPAVASRRARQLPERGPGPDAGHRGRSGPAVRAAHCGCHVQVAETGSGAASSMRNTGQQVGGSRLAVLGTAAWTAATSSIRIPGRPGRARLMTICPHAPTTRVLPRLPGGGGAVLLALALTIVAIRVGRTGLAGPGPGPQNRAAEARQSSGGKMKLTIFAATGGIGRQLLEQAVAAGHDVTAVVRNPGKLSRQVHTVTADLAGPAPAALESAVAGADGVLSGLGPRSNAEAGVASQGTRAIVTAMRATGTRRVVVVSAAPVGTVPSPGRPNPPRHDPGDGFFMRYLAAPVTRAALRKTYADLALMEEILRESGLDWTVIRPPRLTGKPLTGSYRTASGQNLRRGLFISRANVAHLMLGVLEQPETIHRAIGIAN